MAHQVILSKSTNVTAWGIPQKHNVAALVDTANYLTLDEP